MKYTIIVKGNDKDKTLLHYLLELFQSWKWIVISIVEEIE